MIYKQDFISVDNTVSNIIRLIKRSAFDKVLNIFNGKTLQQIFDFISKEIKYIPDPMNVSWLEGGSIELLRSPKYTLLEAVGDCDDKHILAGAIFYRQGIPIRIVIVSNKPDKKFHHIYLEILIPTKTNPAGNWKVFDATYPTNKLFEEKPFTRKKIYEEKSDGIYSKEIEPNEVLKGFMQMNMNMGKNFLNERNKFNQISSGVAKNMLILQDKKKRFLDAYPELTNIIESTPAGEMYPDEVQILWNNFK